MKSHPSCARYMSIFLSLCNFLFRFMQLKYSKIIFCICIHKYILYGSVYDIFIHTYCCMGPDSQNQAYCILRDNFGYLQLLPSGIPLDSWHPLR